MTLGGGQSKISHDLLKMNASDQVDTIRNNDIHFLLSFSVTKLDTSNVVVTGIRTIYSH